MAQMRTIMVSGLAGAGAGWWRKNDIDKGRTTLSKQWGTYIEGGLAASGMIADLLHIGFDRNMLETASVAGFTLLGERLSRSALSGSFGTGAPMGISGRSYSSAPMMYLPPSSNNYPTNAAFAQKERSATVW